MSPLTFQERILSLLFLQKEESQFRALGHYEPIDFPGKNIFAAFSAEGRKSVSMSECDILLEVKSARSAVDRLTLFGLDSAAV